MFDQQINCDVKKCRHNDAARCVCELSNITVVGNRRADTACEQFEQ